MKDKKKSIYNFLPRIIGGVLFLFLFLFSRTLIQAVGSDINNDGCTDSTDFQSVQGSFGAHTGTNDINSDGKVDVKDVAIVMNSWGNGCSTAASCPELDSVVNKDVDASAAIQACIKRVTNGGRVELPAGKYVVHSRVGQPVGASKKSFTITTKGKTSNSAPCTISDSSCAQIVAAADFNSDGKSDYGVFSFDMPFAGSTIDHIILDGNQSGRKNSVAAARCVNEAPQAGTNFNINCDSCTVQNSVTKNALCATGLGVAGSNLTIQKNIVANNGTHNQNMRWADGLTANEIPNSKIQNNTFMNNTDVDLIVGGGANLRVLNNVITHDADAAHGSFTALALYDWKNGPDASKTADFTGSLISGNSIDCGSGRNCGIGILLGRDPWGPLRPVSLRGAVLQNNTVFDAGFGILADDVLNAQLSNNTVSWRNGRSGTVRATCGSRPGVLVGQGKDSVSVTWGNLAPVFGNWDNCIMNWAL